MGQIERQSLRWAMAAVVAVMAFLPSGTPARAYQGAPLRPLFRPAALQLTAVATGLASPLQVTHAGDGSGRLFIVEQGGVIKIVRAGAVLATPFLDISGRIVSGGEQGLLSVAFHPQYAANGRFFVNYTADQSGLRTIVAEYRVSANPDVADTAETVILDIAQPFANHNGGLNKFGPDGMFYIGTGDGGSAGDPLNNGQRLDTLLGKILRIDVNVTPAAPAPPGAGRPPGPRGPGTTYLIPADNPFVGRPDARGEIWAYGFRNPWRWSFDRLTGRLFVADVGQASWEEVSIVQRGGNYGWRIMEAAHCFNPPTGCSTAGLQLPLGEYSHTEGCSVTGGYVYRGRQIPALRGQYLFGDFCSKRIWSLQEARPGVWIRDLLLQTTLAISSFGEDESGEVYVVDLNGGVYRITQPSAQPSPSLR
jgi:glucose/arabinose dehydrogenase